MTRRGRIALKVGAWAAFLLPLGFLVQRAVAGDLGANPISFVTNWLGDWTLRILLASLAVTPLRIVFGLSWPLGLRRLLGLFALFCASLHFGVWIALDHYFDWAEMGADIVKRPYITVGMSALILMLPLAATSTTAAIKRLGGRNWQRLHRLAYAIGVCAVLHYLWLAKVANPTRYYAILAYCWRSAAGSGCGRAKGTRLTRCSVERARRLTSSPPRPGGRQRYF
jgi:sulfoxide reductase heme-binding subunit YedZ